MPATGAPAPRGSRLALWAAAGSADRASRPGIEVEPVRTAPCPPSSTNVGRPSAQFGVHGVDQVGHSECDPFQGRPREVRHTRGTRQTEDRTTGGRLPVRRAQAGQRRDENDLVRRVGTQRQRVDIRRGANRLQAVPPPKPARTAAAPPRKRSPPVRIAADRRRARGHARVVIRPRFDDTIRPPVCASRNAPVP